ncbi:methoprene-tolerant protein-2 [Danaus plexippus plexippus]|uniref:Methoprene-tolerant protein-2 n=1 Tax=Danaus plexippus plexippus TaxID=278856 RepID=A0A212FDU0_DANPL|nr:methoprene-tolerant protein-2 [Danaus plexippus plexippus]
MADWPMLECDYHNRYDSYQYNYYQEKDEQPLPSQCLQTQAQPYRMPSPTLTLLLSPPPPEQTSSCTYKPASIGESPREVRNKAEKQRRDKMNQSISRLATIVPTVVRPGRKLDKTSILRLTAHYLRSHQHVFGNSIDRSPEFSMQFIQGLLKNLKGFLITITYKGLVVVVSPNVQEYLGYSEVELLGQNILNIIHEDDHQLLREQIYPRSCTLGSNGELLLPRESEAEKKVMKSLINEKRNFILRFKKMTQQRSNPPEYITCHVEGSLRKSDRAGVYFDSIVHIGRRVRARGENPFASGNDVVFIGMVRPTTETFITESGLESFKMEYRTRHSIDGEIIQCEQRIALVTGYMTHEVNGVNAMNFMHRDDVRWVIIALREMYDKHRLVGESCYRLMTKNGQFIYMRTLGHLDVDQNSKEVTSFVCTNTVVAEHEGKKLIKLMKKKFTLMINNNEAVKDLEDSEVNDKKNLPVEDPRQLEKVILHLVTNLPSFKSGDIFQQSTYNGEISPPELAIIPPRKEKIQKAIERSYSLIKNLRDSESSKKQSPMFNHHQSNEPLEPKEPMKLMDTLEHLESLELKEPLREETHTSAFVPVSTKCNSLVLYRPNPSNAFASRNHPSVQENNNLQFPNVSEIEKTLPMEYIAYPGAPHGYKSHNIPTRVVSAPIPTPESSFMPIPETVIGMTTKTDPEPLRMTPELSPVISPDFDLDYEATQKILEDFFELEKKEGSPKPIQFVKSPFENLFPPVGPNGDNQAFNCFGEPTPSTSGIKRHFEDFDDDTNLDDSSLSETFKTPRQPKKYQTKKLKRSQTSAEYEIEKLISRLNKIHVPKKKNKKLFSIIRDVERSRGIRIRNCNKTIGETQYSDNSEKEDGSIDGYIC